MIFIPGHVPSSKNSKQWTGKMLISSKPTLDYKKNSIWYYTKNKNKFLSLIKDLPKPYKIAFFFIRKTKHNFDFINACQIVQDIMVSTNWLIDDNMTEMVPYPLEINGEFYKVDPTNAGVIINVVSEGYPVLQTSLQSLENLFRLELPR